MSMTPAPGVFRARAWTAAWVLLAALVPFIGVYPVFMMKALCLALLASAFNLLYGYGGLLSFGHAAFYGTAAYVTGYTMKHWGLSTEVGIALGTLAATVLGVCMGALAIRRQGIYFAMVTLALAQMLYFFYLQASEFTGGEDGIQAVPRGKLIGVFDMDHKLGLYYLVLTICLAGFGLIHRVVHSPFGHALKAIRENEPRAVSLGYMVNRYKILVFTLSAGLAGLAGATKTIVLQLASLTDVYWGMSGEIVLMTLLGGVGTFLGPIVGAFILIGIGTYLASLGAWITMLQGTIFIVCVLAFRRGIVGSLEDLFARRQRASHARLSKPLSASTPTNQAVRYHAATKR
jgi:branched-chain amino acid transport system permease protein